VLLLAFDTATPAVTVALSDGAAVLAESTTVDARRHGELLAPAISTVLREAGADRRDVTDLAVGVGPGPFTGLRVGLMTARALGDALGLAVVGVCTLDVLSFAAGLEGAHRVATDARRKEVYWAAYESRDRVTDPQVDRPEVVAWDGPVVGQGARLYPAAFPTPVDPQLPDAGALCRYVVAGRPTVPPLPLYLRRPDAVEPQHRKPVLS
jgi:tRNA threonylcarbamoyl adenosine modification protein YeaZ